MLPLTFKPECKLAGSGIVIRIVVKGCTVHVPSSPVKHSSALVTASNHQRAVAVVFKLRAAPCHYRLHLRDGDISVRRTVHNHGTRIVCEQNKLTSLPSFS